MVIGVVEMMDLRLKLFDAFAASSTGQFKSSHGRGCGAKDEKKIQDCRDSPADENKNRPNPFAIADGVNEHPDLKRRHGEQPRIMDQITGIQNVGDQRGEHGAKL